jgi:outer membrane protein OmpA-like peptidoglycan-associated protein/opacity protein-like surface antigen
MRQIPGRRARAVLAVLVGASLVTVAGSAAAQSPKKEGVQFEVGVSGGVHLFSKHSELGVADDPTLTSPKNAPLFALRLGVLFNPMFALEAEGVGIPTKARDTGLSAFVVGARGSLVYNIMPGQIAGGKFVPFVLAGAGILNVASTKGDNSYTAIKKDTDFEFHGGVGAKYFFTDVVHLRVDARAMGVPSTGPETKSFTVDWEFMAGIGFTFGGHAAAPPPPLLLIKDSDNDGIPDDKDRCPTQAGPKENGGCPDKDSDGDGIVDRKDKCPDKAGPAEREGCPEEDKDNDGIVDEKDKCPDEPEDKDQFEDEDGCPDPDNDKDGVLDAQDKCPNEPETKNGYQDDDGCPDEVPATVKKFTGVVKGINFRRNSADIKASSFPLLKEAVSVFKEYPALRVEISGHTSDEGKRDFNMKLSRKRAEAVKLFLVSAGVDETRVGTVGYGPDKPIADNETKEGKEKNRRIEFRLLGTGEKVQTQPEPEDINPAPDRDGAGKAKGKAKGKAAGGDAKATGGDAKAKPKGKGKKSSAAPPPEGDPMPAAKSPGKDKPAPKDKAAPADKAAPKDTGKSDKPAPKGEL